MPRRHALRHPARVVPLAFLATIVIGTVLLMLPISRSGPGAAPLVTALFTSTSAVCVTGLIVVDTPTYWSGFGQGVILALFQVGGFGIMALATLLGVLVARRLGLYTRLLAQAETKTLALGEVRGVLGRIGFTFFIVEASVALILSLRFSLGYGMSPGKATWHGVFHAVSAFNNAGFSVNTDSLMRYAADPWVNLPVIVAVIIGGLGFPVLFELRRELRKPGRWSMHTKIVLLATALLLPLGAIAVLVLEWNNPGTLGPRGVLEKVLAALFQSVTSRTAGFNTIDTGALEPATLLVTDMLMFIGGGSASTAGGIKVTTFLLLAFVIWAEVRGEPDVHIFNRRLMTGVQRQALTIALLGVAFVAAGTLSLQLLTDHTMDKLLFEAISAFATVGLSTGITGTLGTGAQLVLVILMYVGRVGSVTVGAALALRSRRRLYRLPEDRPIVG
ncbi:MAG: TrkH family potassium uptake protein [Micromonosporaceae bacterium]